MSLLDESLISARLGELIADARFADALAMLDQCILSGADDGWLSGMRSLLLLEVGQIDAALTASATAVQRAPSAAFAHWTRGVVLLRAGIIPGAQQSAERAVALDPEEPDTHVLMARVYLQRAMWEHARLAIADATTRGADEEELLPLQAAISAGRGLDARACDTWRVFARLYPANALARTGHAWTLLESGDVKAAHNEFQQARELDPTNGWALEGLVITETRLLPVHRRWITVLYGRVMQRREEAIACAGAVVALLALVLLATDVIGVGAATLVTLLGAGLPMLDAWRSERPI